MLQINTSTSPLSHPPAAGDGAPGQKPASADGFEALLAGLIGIAVPPFVQLVQARPISLELAEAGAPNEDGEAAAGDAVAGTATAGDEGTRPADEAVPDQGRAELPPTPRPDAAPPAVAIGDLAADAALSTPRLPTGQQVSPRPGEPVVGDAAPDPRPAGQGLSSEAVPTEQLRPPVEPVARRRAGERPAALVEAIQQSKAPPDSAAPRGVLPDPIPAQPGLLDRPLLQGPFIGVARPAFASLTLQADWGAPADPLGSSSLVAAGALTAGGLTGAVERAAVASADALTGSTTPAIRQLAVAIERAAGGELRHLTIQLSPKALGTIEIALGFDADRRLAVVILAERPETLELLRGEARDLQRLLVQQGIDLADAGLDFGLMGGERRFGQPADGDHQSSADGDGGAAGSLDSATMGSEPPRLDLVGTASRLNLSI
jgi:flagellar hook-length control protein FliK